MIGKLSACHGVNSHAVSHAAGWGMRQAAMPHKPLSQILDLSSAAGSAQIAVSSQSGDCSVTDEFQSTHLRLTRLVNSELTAACMHAAVTGGCDDLQNSRGSQYWWR